MEDNLINEWASFDNLNKLKKVSYIRCGGNPIMEQAGKAGRNILVARMQ